MIHRELAQQALFAASPLLLLMVWCLSSLAFCVVAVGAPAGGAKEGDGRGGLGGLGGGSFGLWGSSNNDEPSRQGGRPHWSIACQVLCVWACFRPIFSWAPVYTLRNNKWRQ